MAAASSLSSLSSLGSRPPARPPGRSPRHLAAVPALGTRRVPRRPAVRGRPVPAATYYRRRLVVALVVTVVALAAWLALGGPSGAGTPAGPAAVEVRPGDTMWSVALRLRPGGDPRPLVDRLVAAHGTTVVRPGERIGLPGRA